MKNESKKQVENINNDDEKLLLSDVSCRSKTHEHKCPDCGTIYEHDNKSNMSCYGYETRCNACYVAKNYGN